MTARPAATPHPAPPARPLAATPRWVRWTAAVLALTVLALVPVLVYAPWVQTAHGTGRALAFNPAQRPQPINSPIAGRVFRWYVVEGDKVRAGQPVAELKDNDPQALERLEAQQRLVGEELVIAAGQVADLRARYENVAAEQPVRLAEVDARVQAAEAQEVQALGGLARAKADVLREEQALARVTALNRNPAGPLASGDAVEEATRRRDVAVELRGVAEAGLTVARRSQQAVRQQRKALDLSIAALLPAEKVQIDTRERDQRAVEQRLQAAAGQVERQRNQSVAAPADGTIFQILANADGQFVSPGQPLAVLVPDIRPAGGLTDPRAAAVGAVGGGGVGAARPGGSATDYPGLVTELMIDGNDLPLVAKGDRVLLQFEGWPAVQVAGVPGAAQGTFEGLVYLVDPTADRTGKFRLLVEPLNPGPEPRQMTVDGRPATVTPWPDPERLRQGVRAQGWVLVREVTVGFELWRQINGFPPAREDKPAAAARPLGPVGK